MTLYQSVFYTKRILVILVFLLFICSGVRIFNIVSNRLAIKEEIVGAPKSEAGFGKLPPLEINEMSDASNFKPNKFRITTISGLLDTENGYPKEENLYPIVNVFKVLEKPIDITNTEDPIKIAQAMNFNTKYKELSNVKKEWNESNRKLTINGQYKTVKYQNFNLMKNSLPSDKKPNNNNISNSTDSLKSYFENTLNKFKIPLKFDNYRFNITYLNYDESNNLFYPAEIQNPENSNFFRIDAKRIYPSIHKEEKPITTTAAYPSYYESINYMIFINNSNFSNTEKLIDFLVELSIFNWPLEQKVTPTNVNIQTYDIITTKEAYERLIQHQAKLVAAINTTNNQKIKYIKELEDIDIVDILKIRLEYYEDIEFARYIQPIYVFTVEAQKNNQKYELIYYLPALNDNFVLS